MRPLGFEGSRKYGYRHQVCSCSAAISPFFAFWDADLVRSKQNENKQTRMSVLRENLEKWKTRNTKTRAESETLGSPKNTRNQLHSLWKRPHLQGWAIFLKQGRRLSALFMLPLWNSIFQTRYVEIECDESRSQVSSMWEYQTLEKCTPSHAVRRKKTALYMPRVRFEFYREVNSLFPLFFILQTWRFLF